MPFCKKMIDMTIGYHAVLQIIMYSFSSMACVDDHDLHTTHVHIRAITETVHFI